MIPLSLGISRGLGAREIARIVPRISERIYRGREGVVTPDTATFLRPHETPIEPTLSIRRSTIRFHRRGEPSSSRSRKIRGKKIGRRSGTSRRRRRARARERERVPTFPRRSGLWVTSPEGRRGEAGRKKTGTRKGVLTSVSSFPLDAILTTSRWRSGWRSSGYLLRATRRVLHSHCSRCVLRSTILRYTVRYRARSDRACTPYDSTLRSTRVDRARANRTLALIALRARGTALAGEFRQRARLEKGRGEGERRAGGEERRRWGERSETSCTSRATRRDATRFLVRRCRRGESLTSSRRDPSSRRAPFRSVRPMIRDVTARASR